VTEAIFGLAGVLVGSAIGWVNELWRARRGESDEARVAARLVIDELRSIDNARTVNEPQFRRQRELALKQESWLAYRAVLARELPNEHWLSVRAAYDALASPQHTTAGERLVDEQYEAAMCALEPVADRRRYWWQRMWVKLRRAGRSR
jgi:hypothetical protein